MADGETIGGGCACGAVRYAFSGKMMWHGICHCAVCRKMSGAAFGAWFGVFRDNCETTGDIAFYEITADSGNIVRRGTCAICRSPVYNQNSKMPDVLIIAAGSLDRPELFAPRMRLYADNAPAWCASDNDGMTRFPGMPVAGQLQNDSAQGGE